VSSLSARQVGGAQAEGCLDRLDQLVRGDRSAALNRGNGGRSPLDLSVVRHSGAGVRRLLLVLRLAEIAVEPYERLRCNRSYAPAGGTLGPLRRSALAGQSRRRNPRGAATMPVSRLSARSFARPASSCLTSCERGLASPAGDTRRALRCPQSQSRATRFTLGRVAILRQRVPWTTIGDKLWTTRRTCGRFCGFSPGDRSSR
jgi:hypothetical protein